MGFLGSLFDPGKPARRGISEGIQTITQGGKDAMTQINTSANSGVNAIRSGLRGGVGAVNAGYNTGAGAIRDFGTRGIGAINSATRGAQGFVGQGATGALGALASGYGGARGAQMNFQGDAQRDYQPRINAGNRAFTRTQDLLGLNGGAASAAALQNFRTSPGYTFQMDQGTQALDRSASARGGVNSGAALKALTRFGQGLADQEFGTYFDRVTGIGDRGFQAQQALTGVQGQVANNLSNLATGLGQNRANVIQQRGQDLAQLSSAQGAANANIYGAMGTNLANMATGRGDALAALYGNQSRDLASIYANRGNTNAQILTNTAGQIANGQTALGANRANSSQSGMNFLGGLIGLGSKLL